MESYLLDWASLLFRWLHVITAIAWIGSSFYFVFLDSSLVAPKSDALRAEGATGEIWAVHGGGFYHPVKYAVRPPELPPHLHWFYWEAYSTWLSGIALFTVTYVWNAGIYLVDKAKMDWSPGAAVSIAVSFFIVFWVLYDQICQRFGGRKRGEAIVGVLVLVLVAFASWLACRWFPGRAAFLIVGAMIATTMSANVFFWIIPGQRKVVAAIRAGEPVDPIHGWRGKQRSVHNTYFTLPVLFAMLSNHYSFVWSGAHNWLVLIAMMFAGAAIRQFFVLRHGHRLGRVRHPWPYALAGVVVIAGVIVWLRPAPSAIKPIANEDRNTWAPGAFGYETVRPVLEQRCDSCHGAQVQMKGVRLDSAGAVREHAAQIHQQVVVQRLMPMNNATGITEDERARIDAWFKAGADTGSR